MKIGILQFELLIHGSQSLKDKRRVVKSVKDTLHREHMVAVAEVGALEIWNLAVMGLACVSRDGAYLSGMLDRITSELRSRTDAELGDVSREILDGDQLPGSTLDEEGRPLWTPAERREDADDGPASGDLETAR
jgi:uncharacterized protein YlxP (DUF503 family)